LFKSKVPLPPELIGLPTIVSEPWVQVDESTDSILEGPAFDRQGNLYVTSLRESIIRKITPQKQISTIFNNRDIRGIDGAAFHKDGRLFVVCLSGVLLVMNSNGSGVTCKYPKYDDKPLVMNDLVFDPRGNIYVTDYSGSAVNPTGGVYRLSPDGTIVIPVVLNLATPNGISIAPEGNVLWVGETSRNNIVRIELQQDGLTPNPGAHGVNFAYHSTGSPGGPDSNKVDVEGNLYQCISGQGRVIVLNKFGIPITNILIPGRDDGKHLGTTNLAFKPGTCEAYVTVGLDGGAWIYRFNGLAQGLPLYSHQ
jgi:lactonase